MRVTWSRDLAESGRGGYGTFRASIASHGLINTFWVRQTDTGINDGAGIISLVYLDLQSQGRAAGLGKESDL